MLGDERLQLLEPGGLHFVHIDARLLHVGGIPGLRQAKRHKPSERLIGRHGRGQLLQLGGAIGERAILHPGRKRLGILLHPEWPLGGIGSLHDLPQNRHLLVGQLLATVGVGGSEFGLQIAQTAQEWLESLARLRAGIGLLASPHSGREKADCLSDIALVTRHLRRRHRPPGIAAPHQRPDEDLPILCPAFNDGHDVVVGEHVPGHAIAAGRQRARGLGRHHRAPLRLGAKLLLRSGDAGKFSWGRSHAVEQLGKPLPLKASRLQIRLGGQEPLEGRRIA